MILDIVNNQYNANLFNKINQDDQRIISNFVRVLKIPDIDMSEFDAGYQLHYEVLLGEINSGNNKTRIERILTESNYRRVDSKISRVN
jgi:hypothetical protein